MVLDLPLLILFTLYVTTVVLEYVHDNYLYQQLRLMVFQGDDRQYSETTYYHRYCTKKDFDIVKNGVSDLIISPTNNITTAKDCAKHIMTYGASMYPNLITNETAAVLREWIIEQNYVQEGFGVIENENRFSWAIDINMHPYLQKYFQELLTHNPLLVPALEEIVGPESCHYRIYCHHK